MKLRLPLLVLAQFCLLIGPALADEMTPSPKETFTVVSRAKDDGEGGKLWSTAVLFPEGGAPETPLNAEEEAAPWPPEVKVSPNDRWILRIQKIGSGQNTAYLYRVEENQRVTRLAQPLEDFAWQALADARQIPRSGFSQMKVEFVAWDLDAGVLKFRIIGFTTGENDEDVKQVVAYDLAKNKYALVK